MAGNVDFSEDEPISSINVTPFVDVVLVLLVIFMVTAPMIMKDAIGIKLPKSATSSGNTHKGPRSFSIAINEKGEALIAGKLIPQDQIEVQARAALAANPEVEALISADTHAQHGDVVRVLDTIKTAGLTKFAIEIQKK